MYFRELSRPVPLTQKLAIVGWVPDTNDLVLCNNGHYLSVTRYLATPDVDAFTPWQQSIIDRTNEALKSGNEPGPIGADEVSAEEIELFNAEQTEE